MKVGKGPTILVVFLAVALVGIWLFFLGIIPVKKTVKQIAKRESTVETAPEKLKKKTEETALFFSHWLKEQEEMQKVLIYHKGPRDPLRLPAKEELKAKKNIPINLPSLSLKGIAWDETQPLAFINDLVVREGETIQGVKIAKIDFDQVQVWYLSKKFVIKLVE